MKTLWDKQAAFWLMVVTGSILEVVGDYFLKSWSVNKQWRLFSWGLFFYFGGSAFWAWALKFENLSRAIGIFFVINVLIAVWVGVVVFDEHLTGWHKLGIVFGLASLSLLSTK